MKSHLTSLPLVLLASGLAACTGQAAAVSLAGSTSASGPVSSSGWQLFIPVVVPLLIAGVKWLAPKIPGVWLPVLAPVLGAGLDIVLHYAGLAEGNGLLGAVLGAAGVGLREVIDQVKKLHGDEGVRG